MDLQKSTYGNGTAVIVFYISCAILALSLVDTGISIAMMQTGHFEEASLISKMFYDQFGYLGFLIQDVTIFLFYFVCMMVLSFVNPYFSIGFGSFGILINLQPIVSNIILWGFVL